MNKSNSLPPVRPDEYIYVPPVSCAYGECPCEHSRHCSIWMEYQIAMVSLHDSEELSHGNWLEITRLRRYIDYLEALLEHYQIDHRDEFDATENSIPGCNRLP